MKMKELESVSTKELDPWFRRFIEPGTLILTNGWWIYNFLEPDYGHDA